MSADPSTRDYRTVSQLLGDVRGRIRAYVWLEAVLLVLLVLGVVFWGGLLLDWMFEPSPAIRLAMHAVLVAASLGILLWWGLRRWMVALADHSLALLVERKYPEFNDAISAAVDLHEAGSDRRDVHPELAARTMHEAAEAARQIDTRELLNRLRLNRLGLVVGGLAVSVIALALAMPQVWRTYTQRLALSPDDWPRSVSLTVPGFEPDGQGGFVRKVPRNADVPVVVNASLEDGLTAPQRVTIRYRWQEGRRGRDDLVRIGDARAGQDPSQRYEYLFERIASDVEFDIRGGDDRVRRLRLQVVERPKVTALEFVCTYPDYLERSNRTIAAGPRIELPEGTRITAVGQANKPLEEVRWRQVVESEEPQRKSDATGEFESTIELGRHDVQLEVELLDTDGIASAEPFRVTIAARGDELPEVLAARAGIGSVVTERAQLPIELTITDDNAVAEAWLDLRHGEEALPQMPVALPRQRNGELVALATVDLQQWSEAHPEDPKFMFAPGQQLTIVAAARDKYDLAEGSRAASGRALSFRIVTEDELMAQLAGSEQNLRQTFEAVADKLLLLYDSLEKLDAALADTAENAPADEALLVTDTSGDATAEVAEPELYEPTEPATARQSREAGRLAETARQIGDEVLGVAAGFEDIHAQLFNNRIENSELSDRIGNRIATPLRELGEVRLEGVAERIAAVAQQGSVAAAKEEARRAIAEVEELLREMQGLENYNEVIAMLRDIIRQQEQINTKTKDEQKTGLKNLLLD